MAKHTILTCSSFVAFCLGLGHAYQTMSGMSMTSTCYADGAGHDLAIKRLPFYPSFKFRIHSMLIVSPDQAGGDSDQFSQFDWLWYVHLVACPERLHSILDPRVSGERDGWHFPSTFCGQLAHAPD